MSLEDPEKAMECAMRKRKKDYCFEMRLVSNPIDPHLIIESEKGIGFKCRFLF